MTHRRIAHPKMPKRPAANRRILTPDLTPVRRARHAAPRIARVHIHSHKKRSPIKIRLILIFVLRIPKAHRRHRRPARVIASTGFRRRPHAPRRHLRILRLALHQLRRIVKSKRPVSAGKRQRPTRPRSRIASCSNQNRRNNSYRHHTRNPPSRSNRARTTHPSATCTRIPPRNFDHETLLRHNLARSK